MGDPRNVEIAAVRAYLENVTECRRYQLLRHFDVDVTVTRDNILCCDVCASLALDTCTTINDKKNNS